MVELDGRTSSSIAAYDEHARAYQEHLRLRRPAADVRRFASYANRGDLVLDVGCGPANDLRLLRDAGLHPVGIDLSIGALKEARVLLPRHPLVRAPFADPPFRDRVFGGLWMSAAFSHLPRAEWGGTLERLLRTLAAGPVYFSCHLGEGDLEPETHPVLGAVHVSSARPEEVEALLVSNGVTELLVEERPDPHEDLRRPWVVALGRVRR